MWKVLRNLALLLLLLAGGLKLALSFAARQEGLRLTGILAPYAQLHYDGISAGIDGSIALAGVTLVRGGDTYTAEHVTLAPPGPFWLIQRWLTNEATLPAHLHVDVQGVHWPASAALFERWISPLSLVPFETQGCGVVSHFSLADYQRMGLNPGKPSQHADLNYDAQASSLELRVTLLAPGFSDLVLHTELQHFEPRTFGSAESLRALHLAQFALDYTDQGYLQRRNKFCAQQAGVEINRFVDQHVAAVLGFLHTQRIEPGADLSRMYRELTANGGRLGILSLPRASFSASQLTSLAPAETLRELNLTARYNEAPPIMFRVAFAPPSPEDAVAAALPSAPAAASAQIPVTAPANPAAASSPVSTSAPLLPAPAADKPAATKPVVATTPPSAAPVAPLPEHAGATPPAASKTAASLPLAAPVAAAPSTPALVEHSATRPEGAGKPVGSSGTVAPSTPAPTPGSTLALVWKPEIERLPPPAEPERDYDVIEYAALNAQVGKRVRLITEGGKSIEGYVLTVDGTGVALRVSRIEGAGSAQLQIARTSIREVQLLRHATG